MIGWGVTAGFLRSGRVRAPAPTAFYISLGPGTGRPTGGHMGPPLRRTWKQFLLFRRGRTLAGPREGQIPIPFVSLRSTSPLDKGSRPPCRGKACGRPGVPPLRRGWKPSSHFVGAGHWPARIRGAPRSSRPTQKSVLSLPPHPPQCAHWGTFPPGGRLKNTLYGKILSRKNALTFK